MTTRSKAAVPPKAILARMASVLAKHGATTVRRETDSVSVDILDAGTEHLELARQRLREGRRPASQAVTVRRKTPTIIVKAPHKKTA
ncbi:hypothetical protein AB0305_04095 [Arthrobacter sp. NPDC080086]|uniref:hypothetical protein n=1 Tax=Arthrobacter sp. NPDC080086 TaxID=3155917 RepID=UPI00344D7EC5